MKNNYIIIITPFLDEDKNANSPEMMKTMPKPKMDKTNKTSPASKNFEQFIKINGTRMSHCKIDRATCKRSEIC